MTEPVLERLTTAVYTFPTPGPEADGTLEWDATTAVTVQLEAGGCRGLGWTYSSPAAAEIVRRSPGWRPCTSGTRSTSPAAGRRCTVPGATSAPVASYLQAISAVDIAWWDLKARLLDVPLTELLGRCRDSVPIYGSGGFTTLDESELAEQVQWWRSVGLHRDEDQDRRVVGHQRGTRPAAGRPAAPGGRGRCRADGRRQRRVHASARRCGSAPSSTSWACAGSRSR